MIPRKLIPPRIPHPHIIPLPPQQKRRTLLLIRKPRKGRLLKPMPQQHRRPFSFDSMKHDKIAIFSLNQVLFNLETILLTSFLNAETAVFIHESIPIPPIAEVHPAQDPQPIYLFHIQFQGVLGFWGFGVLGFWGFGIT